MTHPMSVRFHDAAVAARLKAEATARGASASSLAEELIDEGLRSRRHPMIAFRDGPAGRRACLNGEADVWEVVGGDVPVAERLDRVEQVEAAMA